LDKDINQYEPLAEECLMFAETASTSEHRAFLLEMDQAWRGMAERAARQAKGACDV